MPLSPEHTRLPWNASRALPSAEWVERTPLRQRAQGRRCWNVPANRARCWFQRRTAITASLRRYGLPCTRERGRPFRLRSGAPVTMPEPPDMEIRVEPGNTHSVKSVMRRTRGPSMRPSPSDSRFRELARLATAACLTLPLLAACGGGMSASRSTAALSLGVVDGPVDSASSVVVSFTGVEVQPSGGGQAVTIKFSTPKTIDLLQEQNGNEASLLDHESVPAGNYDWIRLMLNVAADGTVANSYIEINGAQYPLIIPSGAETGLKLVQGFTMTANQVADFTVDFMLQQSITAPPGQTSGGVQEYVLRPALRLVDNVQAGTISGTVALS